jgi:hypothetical protein
MRLIALCASHIDNDLRLQHLRWMLRSWSAQEHPVDLYLSVSTDSIGVDGNHLAESLQEEYGTRLHVYLSNEKLSQFNHYHILAKVIPKKTRRGAWVLFSDDDDLWHPKRSASYHSTLLTLRKQNKLHNVAYISAPVRCDGPIGSNIEKTSDIDDVMHVKLLSTPDEDYVYLSCRFVHFSKFLEKCGEGLRKWEYCDLLFSRHLQLTNSLTPTAFRIDTPCPLYYVRSDERYTHNKPVPRSWQEAVFENGRVTLCRGLNKTVDDVKKTLLSIQLTFEPKSFTSGRACERLERSLADLVRQYWDSPQWRTIREFPGVDMSCVLSA